MLDLAVWMHTYRTLIQQMNTLTQAQRPGLNGGRITGEQTMTIRLVITSHNPREIINGNHQIAQLVNIYCKTGNLYFAFHLGFEVNIQDIITTFITNVFIASAP